MIQTLALFVDAYRELNHKRLFWITLGLSGILVLAFAATGINERGITFLHWTIEAPLTTAFISKEDFYKFVFVTQGLGVWLTWGAMILALISVASIFPDFLASGSIELSLSKPIGRLRLFLTKYLAGLTFVGLQVLIFTLASFLVIGLRGGSWEPGLFVAVPLVLLVFSFIYCICVLFGVITRSTVAALLLTLLAWFLIFLVNVTDIGLLRARTQSDVRFEMRTRTIERLEGEIAAARAAAPQTTPTPPTPSGEAAPEAAPESTAAEESQIAAKQARVDGLRKDIDGAAGARSTLATVHRFVMPVKTILPKNGESVELMKGWLIDQANLEKFSELAGGGDDETPEAAPRNNRRGPRGDAFERAVERETNKRFDQAIRARGAAWVLGTSIAFELVVLSLAAWLFCRRDF